MSFFRVAVLTITTSDRVLLCDGWTLAGLTHTVCLE